MKYSEGKACIRALENDGWAHVCTVMSDSSDRCTSYGMLFRKELNEQQRLAAQTEYLEFWLNKDTYKNLPVSHHAQLDAPALNFDLNKLPRDVS